MAVVPFTSTVKQINWEDLSARKTRIVARRSSKRSARKCVLMWSAKYPESPGRLTYSTKYFNKLHSLQRTVRLFCQTERLKGESEILFISFKCSSNYERPRGVVRLKRKAPCFSSTRDMCLLPVIRFSLYSLCGQLSECTNYALLFHPPHALLKRFSLPQTEFA